MTRSGFTEFSGVLAILKERRAAGQRFPAPVLAIEGRTLWERHETDSAPAARLAALSPSDAGLNRRCWS